MKRNNRGLLSCRGCGWKYTKLSKLSAYIKKTTIIISRFIDWLENKPNKLSCSNTFLRSSATSISISSLLLSFYLFFFFSSMESVKVSIHIITKNKKKKYTQFCILSVVRTNNIFKKFINETSIHNAIKSASY